MLPLFRVQNLTFDRTKMNFSVMLKLKLFSIFTIATLFLFSGCKPAKDKGPAYIEADINSMPSDRAYLHVLADTGSFVFDSTEVKEGKLKFGKPLDLPQLVYITFKNDQRTISFFTDENPVKIVWEKDQRKPLVEGSRYNDSLNFYLEREWRYFDLIEQLQAQAGQLKDEAALLKTMQDMRAVQHRWKRFTLEFAKRNGPLGAQIALDRLTDVTHHQLDSVYQNQAMAHRNAPSVSLLKDRIERLKNLAPGKPLVNLVLPDTTGNLISVKDLNYTYLLLHFWSPMQQRSANEIQELKEIYHRFSHSGFQVVGIALGPNQKKWHQALNHLKPQWPQVIDTGGWDGEAARLYDVNTLPQNALINPYGNIAKRNLNMEELRLFLERATE